MNQQDIEQVVKAVLLKMQSSDTPSAAVHEMGVFASLDDAVAAAKVAQQGLKSVAMRQLAIAAIREAGEKHARDLAELAVSETGMGRVEDKFAKNVAQARGTPGVECLSPQVLTGDNGLTLIENAPWGVVASVTPSTNPAATVINNAISLIAAGNSVIFAPHPAAKKVSQRAITLLNQAIVAAGGPENLLVTVANPDIETAQRLFKFPGIGLLVVTGGEAVVEAARKHTNKRLIAAGAGNPPVVVDETADLARAAQSIVKGASFDNNIICADEKVLIVVDSVADELMRLMEGQHAVKLTAEQAQQLQPVLLKNIDERGKGTVSRDWVGRDAAKIAAAIGKTGMITKPKPKFIRYAGLVKNFRCSLCATDSTGVRCFAEALPDLCFAPAFAPDVRTEEMKDAESRQSVKSAIAALNKVTSSVCKRLPPHAMPIA